jgi:YafQ family addiction module toxin component
MPQSLPYDIELREHVAKIFEKLEKRDRTQLIAIRKKLAEIVEDPQKFKPLHPPMQSIRRVHILKSFVLTYSVVEEKHTIIIEDYAHHNEVY